MEVDIRQCRFCLHLYTDEDDDPLLWTCDKNKLGDNFYTWKQIWNPIRIPRLNEAASLCDLWNPHPLVESLLGKLRNRKDIEAAFKEFRQYYPK